MDEIKTLVITRQNWNDIYDVPEYVKTETLEDVEASDKKTIYDVTFIDTNVPKDLFELLRRITKAHTVFYTENVVQSHEIALLIKSRKARLLKRSEIQQFYNEDIKFYFSKPYGEKYKNNNIVINSGFKGKVSWNGGFAIEIEGEFGSDYTQVAYYKYRIPVYKGQCIEFYFEYKKEGNVSVELEISRYAMGSVANRIDVTTYSEEQLKDLILLENDNRDVSVFISIKAKGNGKLIVNALHDRYSRNGHGVFLPGGERYVSLAGEEVFAYFDPGDMKPPLNIYFSGYKTMEGFEGYYLMKNMGSPFLLLAEARLEGGAFYYGENDYENLYVEIIKSKMDELGFKSSDVIMSGLSMGTTGAMYYSADIKPYAVILGKPLASIGNVAYNELTIRPGYFPTSLDVLNKHEGDMSENSINKLNSRMWTKINAADFSNTIFAVAYMIEDDYDLTAYRDLINNFSSAGVTIYGKGLHGRHNDSSNAIVGWFIEQYKSILRENYKRDI